MGLLKSHLMMLIEWFWTLWSLSSIFLVSIFHGYWLPLASPKITLAYWFWYKIKFEFEDVLLSSAFTNPKIFLEYSSMFGGFVLKQFMFNNFWWCWFIWLSVHLFYCMICTGEFLIWWGTYLVFWITSLK